MDSLPDLCQRRIAHYLPLSSISTLLYINKHWFHFAVSLLYRDPFSVLKETSIRNLLDRDEIHQRLHNLLHLLLTCCGQSYLVSHSSHYRTYRLETPTIDYLRFYTHQTSRAIEQLAGEWPIHCVVDRDSYQYDNIRIALASHRPEVVTHLYVKSSSLNQLVQEASRFIRLQRLEIYCDYSASRIKALDEFYEELQAKQRQHQLFHHVISELALTMPAWKEQTVGIGKPLDLSRWKYLRQLDLMSWHLKVDWKTLPVVNLNDLRLNLKIFTNDFEPATFFGSCTNLQALHVHNVTDTTFSWIPLTPFNIPDTPMSKLITLEVGGARQPLKLSLQYLLKVFSTNLVNLAVVLQEEGTTPYVLKNIHWDIPLPKLHSLAFKDKAVFEFDPAALEYCPVLRHLTLEINAEKANPGCTEVMNPRFGKWNELVENIKDLRKYVSHIESMRFEGSWIFGGRIALLATEPMKRLRTLYLSSGMRSVDANIVYKLLQNMEELTILEVAVEPTDWVHNEGLADLLEKRPNLEIRPTNVDFQF